MVVGIDRKGAVEAGDRLFRLAAFHAGIAAFHGAVVPLQRIPGPQERQKRHQRDGGLGTVERPRLLAIAPPVAHARLDEQKQQRG